MSTDDLVNQDSLGYDYNRIFQYEDVFTNTSIRTSLMANHKFNARHVLRAGVNYDWLWFRSQLRFQEPMSPGPMGQTVRLESDLVQSYLQWQWRPADLSGQGAPPGNFRSIRKAGK